MKKEMHRDSTQDRSTVFHGLCAISSVPGSARWLEALSFIHSQVEIGNLRGLERRYKKEVLSRATPVVDNS